LDEPPADVPMDKAENAVSLCRKEAVETRLKYRKNVGINDIILELSPGFRIPEIFGTIPKKDIPTVDICDIMIEYYG